MQLILGGARSGKSRLAEQIAQQLAQAHRPALERYVLIDWRHLRQNIARCHHLFAAVARRWLARRRLAPH